MTSPTDPKPLGGPRQGQRSTATVAGDVLQQGTNLIQQEVELAKAEMSEKLSQLKLAIGEIVAGAVLVMVSLGILLAAMVSGLARLLMGLSSAEPTAVAVEGRAPVDAQVMALIAESAESARALSAYEGLSALLIGLLFAVVGALVLKNGLDKLDADNLVPERTMRQVKKDGEVVRETL